jgi:type VI secretion system protein ImpC
VDQVVAPHLVPKPDPAEAEARAAGEEAASIEMRAILHHPAFQAIEAAWQGVFFLVRRLETGPLLQVHLIDVSKAELAADLLPAQDLRETQLWQLLVEQTMGDQSWSLLVGNYEFDSSLDDVDLLARIAMAARAAGAPFLAAANPAVAGSCWERLRRMPEAQWVGLALPRFLLRLPYGAGGSAIERFAFEERPEHEDFLWGNPAFACACLIGQAFTRSGWSMRPGEVREVPGLPAYVFKQDGEPVMKPCAETLMTERAASDILGRGPMPLASLKGRDAAILVRFQSIADPPAPLAGRWTR